MQVVAKIFKGHVFTLENVEYVVIGTSQIRGKYFYIIRNVSTNQKQSISRESVLDLQRSGDLKFKMEY